VFHFFESEVEGEFSVAVFALENLDVARFVLSDAAFDEVV
jgi:hypothetical protein